MTRTDSTAHPTTTARRPGLVPAVIGAALNTTARVAPALAGRLALELWRRPGKPAVVRARRAGRPRRGRARPGRSRRRARSPTYAWGDGSRPVLLVHGWGARASRFADLVTALLAAGHSPVSYDAWGHGATRRPGRDDPRAPRGDRRARAAVRTVRGRGRALVRRPGRAVRRPRRARRRPGRDDQRDERVRLPGRDLLRPARTATADRRAAAARDRARLLRRGHRDLGAVLGPADAGARGARRRTTPATPSSTRRRPTGWWRRWPAGPAWSRRPGWATAGSCAIPRCSPRPSPSSGAVDHEPPPDPRRPDRGDRDLVAGLLRELSAESAYRRFQTGIGRRAGSGTGRRAAPRRAARTGVAGPRSVTGSSPTGCGCVSAPRRSPRSLSWWRTPSRDRGSGPCSRAR